MQEGIFLQELELPAELGYASRMTETTLVQNIVALRRHLGLNQSDFADLLGTQQANISKWEKKGVEPSGPYIEAMAEKAGVSAKAFRLVPWGPGGSKTRKKSAEPDPQALEDFAAEYGLAMIEEVDLPLGMGATYLDHHPDTKGFVPFRMSWLRDMFSGPVAMLKVVRGSGDSM